MMEFPDWKDMPKPQPMVTLSWEDIYYKAEKVTQGKFKRDPTQQEITELFDHILHKGIDSEEGTFWGTIEVYCIDYYFEVSS